MSDSGLEPGLAPTGVEGRSLLAQYLRPSVFPAAVEELVATAEAEHAPASAVELLRSLPPATYRTTNEVWVALGGTAETRPSPPDEATVSAEPGASQAHPASSEAQLAASPAQPDASPAQAAASEAHAAAPPWAERLAEASGAVVTNVMKLILAVPVEVGARVLRLVKRT